MSGVGSPEGERPKATAPATRAEILGTLAILGVALGVAAWDPLVRLFSAHPSASQCAELLDKYVEHVAYAADPSPAASALAERKSLAHAAAAKDRQAFRRCEGELTRREVDCAMNAPNADAFERCLPLR